MTFPILGDIAIIRRKNVYLDAVLHWDTIKTSNIAHQRRWRYGPTDFKTTLQNHPYFFTSFWSTAIRNIHWKIRFVFDQYANIRLSCILSVFCFLFCHSSLIWRRQVTSAQSLAPFSLFIVVILITFLFFSANWNWMCALCCVTSPATSELLVDDVLRHFTHKSM